MALIDRESERIARVLCEIWAAVSASSAVLLFPRLMWEMLLFGRTADVFVLISAQECFKSFVLLSLALGFFWYSSVLHQTFIVIWPLFSQKRVVQTTKYWQMISSDFSEWNKSLQSCWKHMWGQRATHSLMTFRSEETFSI